MTITTEFDLETERWRIMASEHGFTATAGVRMFRAPPHPDIQFNHATQAEAERDAGKLRAYLEGLPKARKKKSQDRSAYD